jgi:hypothetical protein
MSSTDEEIASLALWLESLLDELLASLPTEEVAQSSSKSLLLERRSDVPTPSLPSMDLSAIVLAEDALLVPCLEGGVLVYRDIWRRSL